MSLPWLGLSLEPRQGDLVTFEITMRLVPDVLVGLIQPLLLGFRQQRFIDELATIRNHSNMLPRRLARGCGGNVDGGALDQAPT